MRRLCASAMADMGNSISLSAGWLELLSAGMVCKRLTTRLAEEGLRQEDILITLLTMYTPNALRPAQERKREYT